MIMSNRGPPTCGVPIGEQCSSTGVPDDHEQSGTVLAGRTRIAPDECCGGSYRELPAVCRHRRSATAEIRLSRRLLSGLPPAATR
jgi:hypothetical protein